MVKQVILDWTQGKIIDDEFFINRTQEINYIKKNIESKYSNKHFLQV